MVSAEPLLFSVGASQFRVTLFAEALPELPLLFEPLPVLLPPEPVLPVEPPLVPVELPLPLVELSVAVEPGVPELLLAVGRTAPQRLTRHRRRIPPAQAWQFLTTRSCPDDLVRSPV